MLFIMFDFSLDTVVNFISSFVDHHGSLIYLLVFIAAMAEGMVVFGVIPGSLFILTIGAYTAFTGNLSILLLFVLVVFGAFLGDNLGYILGKFFGKQIVEHKWVQKGHIALAKKFIFEHGKKTIFFARFISGIKEVVPFVAGILGMNKMNFMIWNFAGGIAWSLLWLGGGYWFGKDLHTTEGILKAFAVFGAIIFASLVSLYFFKNKEKNNK